ncbi:MAG: hypothetical protein M1837_004029 [Sclerophora amabilis]|nr:MAG: hypothetical protein M1837_004029 [Sclerophora amabilis]
MLDGLFMLLSLSTVMAIASFLAGSLPLSFSLSQSQLRSISTIGMGLLVGTSLIVIIPEGIETLYTASPTDHVHRRRDMYNKALDIRWSNPSHPSDVVYDSAGLEHWNIRRNEVDDVDSPHGFPGPSIPKEDTSSTTPETSTPETDPEETSRQEGDDNPPPGSDTSDDPPVDAHEGKSPHAYVGLSLILGFVLMYLIDQIPQHAPGGAMAHHEPSYISLDNLSQGPRRGASPGGRRGEDGFSTSYTPQQSRSLSTTLGLVIHAAADGIALGASSSSPDTSLGLLIFIAIMVHKAPAAFGLTSVLLKQGLTKRQARAHLSIFSLAAPVGAIATWSVVHVLRGKDVDGGQGTQWWTGILLLFSAGTFLYVAMHTMQEDSESHTQDSSNGYADGAVGKPAGNPKPRMRDTMLAVFGMLLPLLTQAGHVH